MRLPFGLEVSRRKSVPSSLQTVSGRGWFRLVTEPFTGAFQRNIAYSQEDALTYAANYACITLKASDIAKLRIKFTEVDDEGVWSEVENSAYSPVLRTPNHFQTRIQFVEWWMTSKFSTGNTYALKKRDNRGGQNQGNVTALYVLDPMRVTVQVTPSGDVYYALGTDNLANQQEAVVVPASEIIHDVINPLYHPLVGISPLMACALATRQGLRIQNNSLNLFANGSMPSGLLSYPDEIDEDQAKEIQTRWESEFGGDNVGRVAALGLGVKFEPLSMKAVDAQLIEQLQWTSLNCCTAHKVPPYMVGVGPSPSYNNVEALNQQYYSQSLQSPIEHFEAALDKGLELDTKKSGVELDLDGLIRMDTVNKMAAAEKAIKSGMSPNEVRMRFYDLGPVKGGENPLIQQQNYSLEALAKRDASADPFATNTPTPPAQPAAPPTPEPPPVDKSLLMKSFMDEFNRLPRVA